MSIDQFSMVHPLRVRWAEADMQGVVFNAHYLAYADDAVARWFESALAPGSVFTVGNGEAVFDFMVKKATLTWSAGSTYRDTIDLDCSVVRWGTTSFDVRFDIKVREDTIVEIVLTYVGVVPGTTTTMAVPEPFRSALSGATTS